MSPRHQSNDLSDGLFRNQWRKKISSDATRIGPIPQSRDRSDAKSKRGDQFVHFHIDIGILATRYDILCLFRLPSSVNCFSFLQVRFVDSPGKGVWLDERTLLVSIEKNLLECSPASLLLDAEIRVGREQLVKSLYQAVGAANSGVEGRSGLRSVRKLAGCWSWWFRTRGIRHFSHSHQGRNP